MVVVALHSSRVRVTPNASTGSLGSHRNRTSAPTHRHAQPIAGPIEGPIHRRDHRDADPIPVATPTGQTRTPPTSKIQRATWCAERAGAMPLPAVANASLAQKCGTTLFCLARNLPLWIVVVVVLVSGALWNRLFPRRRRSQHAKE